MCLHMYYIDDTCICMHTCMHIQGHLHMLDQTYVDVLVCMCITYICMMHILCIVALANYVLPTMHKGEAYISVSLLLPPFSSQSVTL